MNKYQQLIQTLQETGSAKMKVFGNSMLPLIKSGSLLTFTRQDDYDIVCSKVKSRVIDAHKIIKKDDNKGYLIANNHGYENGWTKTIYGKVIQAEFGNEIKKY